MTSLVYTVAHGSASRSWPRRSYTLAEIDVRARRDGRILRNGYGKTKLRGAGKLLAIDTRRQRPPVILVSAGELK